MAGGLSRRALIGAALATSLPAPSVAAQARPRVVIVGGGAGGASAARLLAATGALEVTLIERDPRYLALFASNPVLGGLSPLDTLLHGYDGLARAGVRLVPEGAARIDRERRTVVLAGGGRLGYDRLVLAPGIALDYGSVPGWSRAAAAVMPHAWAGRDQFEILKARLEQVPDGGLIVILAPPNPYRCPPAPYERASMMAHRLKTTGRGNAKIMIVDPKPKFSMQGLFQEGWERHYPGMVEWMAPDISEGVREVDPATGTVVTGFETYRNADLVNVIPTQRAAAIAAEAGLTDASGWCPVEASSFASTLDPAVFVLGDAAIAGDMPKSAYAAHSQAQVAARAIAAQLIGTDAGPAHYASICWSLLTADNAVKVSGFYGPEGGAIREREGHVSQTGEPAELRLRLRQEAADWQRRIARELFG